MSFGKLVPQNSSNNYLHVKNKLENIFFTCNVGLCSACRRREESTLLEKYVKITERYPKTATEIFGDLFHR